MMTKINGKNVKQASKAEMALREVEIEKLEEWIAIMQHTGDWWPSIDPEVCNLEEESTLRMRKAEKALTGTYLAMRSGAR